MNWSLNDLISILPPQLGNGGRLLASTNDSNRPDTIPATQVDKTTAAAKLILDAEFRDRIEKTARLKAARVANIKGDLYDHGL